MTLDQKALEAVRAAPFRKYTIGETIDDTAIETIITAYLAALPAQPVAVCSVKTMKLSDGREDYYVSILIEGREITPHVFRIKGRAEFEVETWKWLFGQGEEPNIMDWLDRTADPAVALAAPSQQEGVTERDDRQRRVAEWCAAAFGVEHQASVPQRGLRMLEEAIEAYQALDGSQAAAHKLVDYIFAKEPGKLFQELGGLGITVLALAAAAGVSADEAEQAELARVLSKPLEWFHARNKAKNDAGFDATAYPAALVDQVKP